MPEATTKANDRQVGGDHYKSLPLEHWDLVVLYDWDYFQAQITRYMMRWKKKDGLKDLEKMVHFAQKYLEVEKLRAEGKLTATILRDTMRKLGLLDDGDTVGDTAYGIYDLPPVSGKTLFDVDAINRRSAGHHSGQHTRTLEGDLAPTEVASQGSYAGERAAVHHTHGSGQAGPPR